MIVKFNHQLFIDRILDSDKIKFLILGFALLIRAYFIFGRGISIDESSFWSYVKEPNWSSVMWANYPPLFVTFFKSLFWLGFESYQVARGIIFIFSAVSFYLFFNNLKNEKESVPALVFWGICPASLVALGFSPAVFVEFFSILAWIGLKKDNKLLLITSLVGLVLTTYTAFIFVLFLALLFQLEKISFFKRSSMTIGIIICGLLAIAATFFIRWNYLSWLQTGSVTESLLASFEFIRNLLGYSWIGLLAYCYMLFYSKNKKLIVTFFLMATLMFSANLFGGLAAKEPRFVLFFIPWIIIIFSEIGRRNRFVSAIFLLALVYHLSWFAMTKKSGLQDIMQQLKNDNVSEIHTDLSHNILVFVPVEKKVIAAKCCNYCAFLSADFQKEADKKIQEEISKQHLEIVSQIRLGPKTLQPFNYVLAKGETCL